MGEGSSEQGVLQPLADEFLARWRRGENPTISEFCAEHPEQGDALKGLLVTIQMLEGFPSGDETTGGGEPSFNLDEIGGYRIIGEIGRGGMGVVYEAEHTTLARRVAIKVLPHQASQSQSARLRFEREARAAAGMHHTNIVPVFEVGQESDYFFYAMQLIRGQSLDRLIDDLKQAGSGSRADKLRAATSSATSTVTDPHSTSAAAEALASKLDGSSAGSNRQRFYRSVARMGIQVAEALDYAHGRGIIHRDIKPSNLIQDERGVVWLTDFGLAKTDDDGMTQTGDYLGTLRYMSPERFKGECDARSDIYALGLTLYELLLQRPAFAASDRLLLINAINEASPTSPRSVDPRIPRDLETIIWKSIDKDPAARYPSAKALAEDLRRFVSDQPIKARRHSLAERFLRWSRRNRSLATSLMTIGALLVVGVAGLSFSLSNEAKLRGQAEEARGTAEERSIQLQQTTDQLRQSLYFSQMSQLFDQALSEGVGGETLAPLLAQWQPENGDPDLRGWEWYYLNAIAAETSFSSPRLNKDGFRWCWSVDYSPDGTELVNTVNGWGIQIRDNSGDVLREKFLGSARSVGWSPDGTKIAVAGFGEPGAVLICDAKTLEVTREIECPGHNELECVRWSPDSSRIAVCGDGSLTPHNIVRVHRVATGETEQAFEHPSRVRSVDWSPDGSRIATSADDLRIRIWNLASSEVLAEFLAKAVVLKIRWNADGTKLAGAGDILQCWPVVAGEEPDPDDVPALAVAARSVAWHPQADQLAIGCADGSVRLLDGDRLQTTKRFLGHQSEVWSVAWNTSGTQLASAGLHRGNIRLWGVSPRNQSLVFRANSFEQRGFPWFEWTPDGDSLVGTTDIWNLSTGDRTELDPTEVSTEDWDVAMFTRVAVNPTDGRLAFAGRTGHIHLRDAGGGGARTTPETTHWTAAMQYSHHGQLAVLSVHGSLAVWDANGKRTVDYKPVHDGAGIDVKWSPDGQRLTTTATDNYIRLWDPNTWELVWEAQADGYLVSSVCFNSDGSQLATSHEGAVLIWDVASGKQLAQLDAIQERFGSLDWSPDDSRLAVCSSASLSLWDVSRNRVVLRFAPGADCVRWNPDGRRLAIGYQNSGTIRILDASPGYSNGK